MSYETKILQQTGIVTGICNKKKLSDTIDELILNPNRKVSIGKAELFNKTMNYHRVDMKKRNTRERRKSRLVTIIVLPAFLK